MAQFEQVQIGKKSGFKGVSAVYSPSGKHFLVALIAPTIDDLEEAWNTLTPKKTPNLDKDQTQKVIILKDEGE